MTGAGDSVEDSAGGVFDEEDKCELPREDTDPVASSGDGLYALLDSAAGFRGDGDEKRPSNSCAR